MVDLLLTCPPGLEDVVELEAMERVPYARISKRPLGVKGHLLLSISDPEQVSSVLSMRSIHHVMRYVTSFRIGRGRDALNTIYREVAALDLDGVLNAGTRFRVTSARLGRHEFTSMDVQRTAGQALVDRFSSKVDLEHYDVEVRVDVVGEQCIVGIALTRESLHRRGYRAFHHRAALKPSIAYAMLRLAEPSKGNILVDPMCGSGTIPIEAALSMRMLNLELYGMDVNGVYIDGARADAERAGVGDRIRFMQYDCRMLDSMITPDRIVTNPPYGIRMEPGIGIRRLYTGFARAAYRAMVGGGRLVVITLKHGMMRDILSSVGFAVSRDVPVMHGDLWTHILVGEKR
ncbi:MAG: THUMP domain-containing protein [Candidatus Nitrosocaldus sp.]|nr:THUMP domain-containing protein [Candidatus Nitrosocaldus sp.]MDW8000398.1 THUMP domain-containing protein [Candidatus Nitrosocaldus sp.]